MHLQQILFISLVSLLLCTPHIARTARVPRADIPTEKCMQQSLYQRHTEPGCVILTDDGNFEFLSDANMPGAVAWGSFLDGQHTVSNLGHLRVSTSGEYGDADQVFAAGYLEGFLTAPRIFQNYQNLFTYFTTTMNASLEDGPMEWIRTQDAWIRERCEEESGFFMEPGVQPPPTIFLSQEEENEELDSHHYHHNHNHHRRHRQRHEKHHHDDDDDDDDSKTKQHRRFWDATCLAIRQFDGLVAGYQARVMGTLTASIESESAEVLLPLSYDNFLFLESNGDLYDVIDNLDPSQRPSWNPGGDGDDDSDTTTTTTTSKEDSYSFLFSDDASSEQNSTTSTTQPSTAAAADRLFHNLALSGKCSALVKVASDLSDVFMGHATWDSYTAMLRIYKHYSFNLTELQPAAQRVSFSSYPGEVFSDDDFFILSSKLVMLQTTNKIFNDELFEKLTPQSVLSWQRVRAANWLASSGEEWTQFLEMENSGTYNNQYMIVDLKKFVPGENLREGLFWVAEQIPGKVVAADMTSTLEMGYWPSYNVPAFPEVYEASGYPDFIRKLEKYGQHFSRVSFFFVF